MNYPQTGSRLIKLFGLSGLGLVGLALGFFALAQGQIAPPKEAPEIVDPGSPGEPPSDAVVLFDGADLSQWENTDGGPAEWAIRNGTMMVNGTGNIRTKEAFGDCQLHIEWATPADVQGEGQGRGNSGVYLQSRYEIQVLDSYQNETYYHGQAGAIYKQHAPLVNASRKPGQWQTYDIIYHNPRFQKDGTVDRPATVTVLHNGVLIQDHAEIKGTTVFLGAPRYTPHPPKQPLLLQDHGNPVRYRNIWIRPLGDNGS